jgi:hypothetical protein
VIVGALGVEQVQGRLQLAFSGHNFHKERRGRQTVAFNGKSNGAWLGENRKHAHGAGFAFDNPNTFFTQEQPVGQQHDCAFLNSQRGSDAPGPLYGVGIVDSQSAGVGAAAQVVEDDRDRSTDRHRCAINRYRRRSRVKTSTSDRKSSAKIYEK